MKITHLDFKSGRNYDVIKIAYIVSVPSKCYVHCSLWQSAFSCILFAHFSRNIPNLIKGGKLLKLTYHPYLFRVRKNDNVTKMTSKIPYLCNLSLPTHRNVPLAYHD